MKTFVLICLAGWFAPVLYAQQPAPSTPRPAVPPGPLLERAPDFAQWTVVTKGVGAPVAATPGGSPQASPSPAHGEKPPVDPADKQTIVVKTKPLRYEQTVTAGGKKTVTWYVPDMQVTSDGGGVPVVAFTGGPNATDYSKSDFAGFEWISPRNFEGTQKVAGQDCLVFRDALKIDGRIVKSEHPLMSVACIAADSRLPVALQLGDEVRTYQFGSAPTAMLTLPPDVEAVVAQWRQTIRRASLPAAKP